MYKTTENHFFIRVTTFGGSAVGYNIWWQLWDTTFGGSCGIQIHKKTKNKKKIKKSWKIIKKIKKNTKNCALGNSKNHFFYPVPSEIIFFTSPPPGEENGGFIHPWILCIFNIIFIFYYVPLKFLVLSKFWFFTQCRTKFWFQYIY